MRYIITIIPLVICLSLIPNGHATIIDTDLDTIPDYLDAFPFDPTEYNDTDADGIGDNQDSSDTLIKVSTLELEQDLLAISQRVVDFHTGLGQFSLTSSANTYPVYQARSNR